MPHVGMEVVVVHLGARRPAVVDEVHDGGRTLVVGATAFTLRAVNGRFVREGDPPFGVRLVLGPGGDPGPSMPEV